MKKTIAAILAVTLALAMTVFVSASNGTAENDAGRRFLEEHTVVWSEASGGKVTLITTTEYDELSTADQISPAFRFEIAPTSSITQLLSDGTEKGEQLLNLAISDERIPAGTVVKLEYGASDDSYPAQIGTPTKVVFCGNRTRVLLTQALPILDTLNGIAETEKYTIDPNDRANFDIVTDFTVVGSTYNEKTKRCDLAISMKEKHFSVAENKELWYYTTTNISVDISAEEDGGINASNDGTKKGKQEYDNLFNRNGYVTYGTVIELRWNGIISESYPPVLCGVSEVTFTGKQTDYTPEEMYQERQAMNEMFLGDTPHYPEEANPVVIGEPTTIPEGNLFQSSHYDNADKNPATGMDAVFAGTALAGVLAWAASLVSLKREKHTENE